MKQSIRFNTFETNSSSYHTLTVRTVPFIEKEKEIIQGEDLEVDPNIQIRYIGDTCNYLITYKSPYQKAQALLRFMSNEVEEQLTDIIPKELYKIDNVYNWQKRYQCNKQYVYEAPLIQAYIKAIKRFTGEDTNITIVTGGESGLWDHVSDYDKDLRLIVNIKNITDIDALTETFYNIIFNPSIEMIEECEGNE